MDFELTGDPTKHKSWPIRWRGLIDVARAFTFCDLLFSHGFPRPFTLRTSVGEALTHAWFILQSQHLREVFDASAWYVFSYGVPGPGLNKAVCKLPLSHYVVL